MLAAMPRWQSMNGWTTAGVPATTASAMEETPVQTTTSAAAAYGAIEGTLTGLPAVGQPAELTAVHGLLAAVFVLAYLAVGSGVYRRSDRLYVALLNAARPPSESQLTTTEEYNEY